MSLSDIMWQPLMLLEIEKDNLLYGRANNFLLSSRKEHNNVHAQSDLLRRREITDLNARICPSLPTYDGKNWWMDERCSVVPLKGSYLLEAILYTTCDWGSLVRFDRESTNTTVANMTHVTQVFTSTPSLADRDGPSKMSEICFAVVAVLKPFSFNWPDFR